MLRQVIVEVLLNFSILSDMIGYLICANSNEFPIRSLFYSPMPWPEKYVCSQLSEVTKGFNACRPTMLIPQCEGTKEKFKGNYKSLTGYPILLSILSLRDFYPATTFHWDGSFALWHIQPFTTNDSLTW
jgi:hypothetical protein